MSFYRRVWADFHLLYLFLQKSMFNKNYHEEVLAEMIGTMVLVLMGCGSAVFAGSAAGRLVQVSERWE